MEKDKKPTSKKKTTKKVEVDPIADMVKARYASGLFNINQLAAQFMVHTSRIKEILENDNNL